MFVLHTFYNMNTNEIIWKDIDGFENYYQVSNTGLIKSKRRIISCNNYKRVHKEHIIKFGNNGTNYLFVYLWKNNKSYRYYVHRLVAKHFIDNPNNYTEVNHKDKNTKNNNCSNLEWIDYKYHKIKDKGIKVIRNDGVIYDTIKDAAINNNINSTTLRLRLNSNYYIRYKTKLSFKYYYVNS